MKQKNIENLLSIIENAGISIDKYEEEGKHCGYELNTYTDGGVNMIVFLDFRDKDKNVTSTKDFIDEFTSYVNDFDIDETICMHRQDKRYTDNFTLAQSLKDFNSWVKKLKSIIKKLN